MTVVAYDGHQMVADKMALIGARAASVKKIRRCKGYLVVAMIDGATAVQEHAGGTAMSVADGGKVTLLPKPKKETGVSKGQGCNDPRMREALIAQRQGY